MAHSFRRFQAQLANPSTCKYIGYKLNRSCEVREPNVDLARKLASTLRAVYALTFALVDVGLESQASPLIVPQLTMENRIMRLGFNESLDGLFTHAHLNFVTLSECVQPNAILSFLCADVTRLATEALASECFYSKHGVFAKQELQMVLDVMAPLVESTTPSEDNEDVDKVQEVVLDEEVIVETNEACSDPDWTQGITAQMYLQQSEDVRRAIDKQFGRCQDFQHDLNYCAALCTASQESDLTTLTRLLALKSRNDRMRSLVESVPVCKHTIDLPSISMGEYMHLDPRNQAAYRDWVSDVGVKYRSKFSRKFDV